MAKSKDAPASPEPGPPAAPPAAPPVDPSYPDSRPIAEEQRARSERNEAAAASNAPSGGPVPGVSPTARVEGSK